MKHDSPLLQVKKCNKCHEEKSEYLCFPRKGAVCKKCLNAYKRAYLCSDPSNKWSNTALFGPTNGRKDIRDHILDV